MFGGGGGGFPPILGNYQISGVRSSIPLLGGSGAPSSK